MADTGQIIKPELIMLMTALLAECPRHLVSWAVLIICLTSLTEYISAEILRHNYCSIRKVSSIETRFVAVGPLAMDEHIGLARLVDNKLVIRAVELEYHVGV